MSQEVKRGLGPVGWLALMVGLIAAGWIVMDMAYRRLPPRSVAGIAKRQRPAPRPAVKLRLRLVHVPTCLPRDIGEEICAELSKVLHSRGIDDESLIAELYHAAAADPWVRRVRRVVRYPNGLVVVDAQYRWPFALAASAAGKGELYVIDREGVVLPMAADRPESKSLVVIRDVASQTPPVGKKWDSPDLRDGLRLLDMIKDKPYVGEITTIDIRNWSEVVAAEPRIRLWAQRPGGARTDIRFGRFPAADGLDYCIDPERKLEYLDAYYRANGNHLAGVNAFVDLRYDALYVSHEREKGVRNLFRQEKRFLTGQ